MNELDFSVLIPYLGMVWRALGLTVYIGVFGFILATVIAVVVGSLRSAQLPKFASLLLTVYVEFFRGTPLLVQLYIVYYGLPAFGLRIDPVFGSILTMGLNSGAYLSETVRAAIFSIDKGQYEAAYILGYNPLQTAWYIVLPQAIQIAIPSFMNGFSTMIKETSIVSVLPIIELTKLGNQIYAKTYSPFEIFISLAVIYFILTYPVTFIAKWLERKFSVWRS